MAQKINILKFAKLENIEYRCWIICVNMPILLGKHKKNIPSVFLVLGVESKKSLEIKVSFVSRGGRHIGSLAY